MDSKEFIDYVLYYLQKGLNKKQDENRQVINYVPPEQLKDELKLQLGSATSLDEIVGYIQQILYYSTNTQSKFYANSLYGAGDLYGTLGDFLTTYLNTSATSYEESPVFTLMEQEIISKTIKLFGFPENSSGLINPDVSISNLYAFQLAKTYLNPKLNGAGLYVTTPMKVFCSDQAHPSIKKSMILTGLGSYHLITIPTKEDGKMDIDKLEQAIKNHSPHPLMVIATAGTHTFGSFDSVEEIVKITKKYQIWLHVDASWGGSIIFSPENKNKLLKNINQADSLIWSPHQMLKIPFQCSIFITRHSMTQAFNNAKSNEFDLGETSFQCERHVDALKFWLPWKIYGDDGYKKHVERNINNA